MHSTVRTAGKVKSADGVEICYEAAGLGEPALVFVHGWSCDRSYWRAQMDYFAASYFVIAVDLGGHGESGIGRDDWTMTAFAEDVQAVVEALNLTNVALVGHSMGGPVIVEVARLIPDRVSMLVPVDYFGNVEHRWSEKELEAYLAPLRSDFRRQTEALARSFFPPSANPNLVDWISLDMASAPAVVAISAMENTRCYDQALGLAAVKAPLRLINSDFWTTDVQALRRYKPDVQLAVMHGVGHFVMMEDSDEFNRLLTNAVRELVPLAKI